MIEKVYTVYKTTNHTNGKYYIGVHKTSNPLDDYYGSGKILKRAIEKYGIENFTKEILAIFETAEEAFNLENELVTFELIESGKCYNLKEGGYGGFDHLNNSSLDHIDRCKKGRVNTNKILFEKYGENWNSILKKEYYLNNKEKCDQNLKKASLVLKEKYPNGTFKGKHCSKEHKEKIGQANSIHQTGEGNSQYGTCWITKDKENKKIQKEDLSIWLDQGWIKGRTKYFY